MNSDDRGELAALIFIVVVLLIAGGQCNVSVDGHRVEGCTEPR